MEERQKTVNEIVKMLKEADKEIKELKRLRLLEKNLRSGVCVNISNELINLLMERDCTVG